MASFLDLPAELILHALWFLDLPDVLSCQLSNQLLHTIIKGSTLFKYLTALKAAGMEDNRLCTVGSMFKRLHMLNPREDAWENYLVGFYQNIQVLDDLRSWMSLGFNGGIYFFKHSTSLSLHYVSLPSNANDEVPWSRIDVDAGIIDIGCAIYEHDLVAIATQFLVDGVIIADTVNISFYQASTGDRYPFAEDLKARVSGEYQTYIKVAGDYLALATGNDSVDVYEWKTGILRMRIRDPRARYQEFLFLSPKVLLLPCKGNNAFQFWDIPESSQVKSIPCPSFALRFPPINYYSTIINIYCNGAPLIRPYGAQYSPFPFHSSPIDDIATFHFIIHYLNGPETSEIHFIMVVHIRSLLNLYSTFRLSSPPPPEESSAGVNVIPWDQWGPAVTRLLRPQFHSASANQRLVFVGSDNISVLDFNLNRTQYLKAAFHASGRTEGESKEMAYPSAITNESRLDGICFEGPVISRLPYMEHIFQNTSTLLNPRWYEVVMDDDRFIRLHKFNYEEGSPETIEVLHIG